MILAHTGVFMSAKGSLIRGDSCPYDGDEDGVVPAGTRDWAYRAARGVLADLSDRSGIDNELSAIDEDTRVEIVVSLADIIREARIESGQ
jgi:hypothetical protein